jgi:vancomycin permeability regulator SanA
MVKTLKKLVALAVVLAILVPTVIFGINFHVKSIASKFILEADNVSGGYDCILILGCKVNGESPSLMLRDRLWQGVELYGVASDKILMTGDHGKEGYDEVGVMKAYAEEAGVPSENIFEDHAGFSTYESMYRAKEIFKAKNFRVL